VLIRCDAAPEIGFGHVVRCLALADELRDSHGCRVDFAMLQGPQGVAQAQAQGYEVFQTAHGIEDTDEGKWLKELIIDCQYQVLVLDVRTDLANEAVQSIRESGVLIVTIDDPSDRRLHADLAFYPPVPQVERMDWNCFTGKRFVGWDWVLLRTQFAEAARKTRGGMPKAVPQTWVEDLPLTVLLTMGGSDPVGFTIKALDAISMMGIDIRVITVLGGAFMHEAALQNRPQLANVNLEILRNVENMASVMGKVDFAISAFGQTAYELAMMRVWTAFLCTTEDHRLSCSVFDRANLGKCLCTWETTTAETFRRHIERIIIMRPFEKK